VEYNDFIKDIKKVHHNRKHKVTNSYGSKDAFHYYRKIKPEDSKYVLTDCQYLKIIRLINNRLRDKLIAGKDVILPEKMGMLELRKYTPTIKFENGKLKTSLPVNWYETLKLWYENSQSKQRKQLVRQENTFNFKVHYNRTKANYNNKTFYEFHTNRDIKVGLKKNINLNKIDAFIYGK
jgi:hypothetical protein